MRPTDAVLWALLALTAGPAAAQEAEPLSAIEWLDAPGVPLAGPRVIPEAEPPVTGGASVPEVTVMPLDDTRRDAVGLLPPSVTGLPASLWKASREADLVALLQEMPDEPLPAIQALYYTLLLAEADAPAGTDGRFLTQRIESLIRMGAVEAAQALLDRAGPERPSLFPLWFDLTLLSGDDDRACRALTATPELHPDYAARIFCTARAGDWPTAALLYETGSALGIFTPTERQLLEQFLDPEMAEGALSLAPQQSPSPLLFRLREAVGTPLPTRNLPRAFAVSDLRDNSGWKAELEAAERLLRTGALSENRLLGLYTERRPAASGGIWDRVEGVQRLEAALDAGDAREASAVLPGLWRQMRSAGLEVPFANLFAERLAKMDFEGRAEEIAWRIALLGDDYEAATLPDDPDRAERFLASVAQGAPDASLARMPLEHMLVRAFSPPVTPAPAHEALLRDGKLGEAILTAANRFAEAADHPDTAGRALRTLRAVGLEDTARRAALQLLLLERNP